MQCAVDPWLATLCPNLPSLVAQGRGSNADLASFPSVGFNGGVMAGMGERIFTEQAIDGPSLEGEPTTLKAGMGRICNALKFLNFQTPFKFKVIQIQMK